MTEELKVPQVSFNPTGWGPSALAKFQDVPYAPFNKSDHVGKVSDWNAFSNAFFYRADGSNKETEDAFAVVDYGQKKPKTYSRSRYNPTRAVRRYPTQPAVMHDRHYAKQLASGHSRKRGQQQKSWGNQKGNQGPRNWAEERAKAEKQRLAAASITVQPDWQVIEQVDFNQLARLKCVVGEPSDVQAAGSLQPLNRAVDRATSQTPVALAASERAFLNVTTTDDPVIQQLATSGDDDVFATDAILALLMTAPRAVDSFDIVFQKIGGKIFLDQRRAAATNLLSVNETATEPPKSEDGLNAPVPLAREATRINQNFADLSVVHDGEPLVLGPPWEPAVDLLEVEGKRANAAAYRYRRYKLGALSLVMRAQLDAYMPNATSSASASASSSSSATASGVAAAVAAAEPALCVVHALNEFGPATASSWRHKLDLQRGAVLAVELKNNSAKIARWATCALLAGAHQMRLGFVSRVRARDPTVHTLLGAQLYKTTDFAKQINLQTANMWGIVQHFVLAVRVRDNGSYILIKDPSKTVLRLFAVPPGTFDDDDDDDDQPMKASAPAAFSASASLLASTGSNSGPTASAPVTPVV